MNRTRNLLLALGLAGTALMAGSSVSYYEESLPSTMNPLFARSMVDYRSHELVFDRLFYRDAVDNKLKSRLVTRFEKNGRELKIFLNSDVKWHDGKPLTASDVCFTVDAMLDPGTPSPIAKGYKESIESCAANDKEGSAVITFTKVFHNPRERVGFSVLPKHAFTSTAISPDQDFSTRPIGTGPMKGSQGRQAVKFTAVPNAHQNPRIQVLTLAEGGDPFVQIKTLINAGVQGVIAVAPPLRPEVAASDDVALKSYDLRSWWFVAINTTRGPQRDVKVRQALNYSIDRTELRELTIGVEKDDPNPPCEFVSGPFVQSSPYYNRQVQSVERSDRAKVQELMTSSGATEQLGKWVVGGQPVSFKIGMNAPLDAEAKDLLNQIGNQLQAAGFDRQVYKVTADTWNRKAVTGQLPEYDLLIGKWSFGLVEDVNSLFHTRKGGKGPLNIFNYSNPAVDAILDRFEGARTDTEAKDAYHELHAYLAEDLPYLFLWKLDTKSAWRNEVRNNIIAPYFYFTEFEGWTFEG
ncbi:MAG: ABC transporter substrate-binding protein [Deltaproteobacteria bacterium]|nr:ABC transporter substrate-binding protein [Deltaproteobacteria bacterium]